MNSLRSCSGSAHILTNDATSELAWCARCKPKHVTPFAAWAAGLKKGDQVYLRPYATQPGLSHSRYLIVDRDGDELTVQVLGMPKTRMTVHVNHCGQHDLNPAAAGRCPVTTNETKREGGVMTPLNTVDSSGRCTRTDLFPSDCAHCRGLPWTAPILDEELEVAAPATVRIFPADRPGTCPACDEPIRVDQLIRLDELGYGYVHDECGNR